MEQIKILFADNIAYYRRAVIQELNAYNIVTIDEASDGAECLEKLAIRLPDVVVLNLDMPVMDGNTTFDHIKDKYPDLKVFILSDFDNNGIIENYIRRQAKGYLPKKFISSGAKILADGIRTVYNSETFYYSFDEKSLTRYTKRETDIIPLLLNCKTSKEISSMLGISEKQVNKIRSSLHKKTNSRNATGFMKYGIESGLKFIGKISGPHEVLH